MYTNTNTIHKEKCNKQITNTNCFNVWVALPRYKWEQMLMARPWFEWPQTNWSNYNSAANESSSFSSADVPLYVGICKFANSHHDQLWPSCSECIRVKNGRCCVNLMRRWRQGSNNPHNAVKMYQTLSVHHTMVGVKQKQAKPIVHCCDGWCASTCILGTQVRLACMAMPSANKT